MALINGFELYRSEYNLILCSGTWVYVINLKGTCLGFICILAAGSRTEKKS